MNAFVCRARVLLRSAGYCFPLLRCAASPGTEFLCIFWPMAFAALIRACTGVARKTSCQHQAVSLVLSFKSKRAPISAPFFCLRKTFSSTGPCPSADQLPKNTLQYDAGPLHCDGAAAWATPEAEAIRAERMRFMVLLLSVWFAIWCDRWTEEYRLRVRRQTAKSIRLFFKY